MRYPLLILLVLFLNTFALSGNLPASSTLPEYRKEGSGPVTMLLIPCMSCRWNSWQEFLDRNQQKYTMYAVTLPGFGGNSLPDLASNSGATPWRDNALQALSEFIDEQKLQDIVLVGHSFGVMVAVQLAARRPDVISRLIAVDGTLESDSWTPSNREDRLAMAQSIIEDWDEKLQDPEEWHKFNGGNSLPAGDSLARKAMLQKLRRFGSFMATPRQAVLQYWRENPLINLTSDLQKLTIPVLDIQAIRGEQQEEKRAAHLKNMAAVNAPDNIKTIFLYDTRHFVMEDRPLLLDKVIQDFLGDRQVSDMRP